MKIKIKNFGPIKDGILENNGWIDIKKVTLFIGDQGSGKSTIAKLISTFMWIEKALVRGDFDEKWLERKNRLKNYFFKYHRLENYFNHPDNSVIEYVGDAFHFIYEKNTLKVITVLGDNYKLPQIMYVPAERNFISYVKSANELKLSSESLQEFLTEFDNALNSLNSRFELPIDNLIVEYDKQHKIINIKNKDHKVRLSESSSGIQSLVPLYLVSNFLSNSIKISSENKESMSSQEQNRFKNIVVEIYNNDNLTIEQKRLAVSALSERFNKKTFINIVEEPEQNLFPLSQWKMLSSLLVLNNLVLNNKLIMTSHSPYIVNYLSISVQARELIDKINDKDQKDKIANVINLNSTISSREISIYELNNGLISKLSDYEGIPSDNNYLNLMLKKGNEIFDQLLEIEEEL
ncbi:ATP-binding protein [Chryseobacterium sp. PBS4-4]|uniref:ATP-binding protein n=1 Tax=Chryseobacterium edaphi TaxID=2976532 RepID=A0ABT2W395_9FLAO|nr:ATP-binding protein [Chryseobacterium edaphi]MCU7616683.1 ATP-binding protein [Chryseobacterium edaphi]